MTVYVTGHKNPDTDSIVSAIAYAALKNALGERNVEAVALGAPNLETMIVLDKFGFEPPRIISDVKTQLSDIDFDELPVVGSGLTVRSAWNVMIENDVKTVFIADERGKLVGKLESNDIAQHDMASALNGFKVNTNAFNLASALEGILLGKGKDWDEIVGNIVLGVQDKDELSSDLIEGCVLISGDRKNIVQKAVEAKVSCLILCEVDADSEVAKEAEECELHVVLTHYDAYRASRLISHSVPISEVMQKDDLITFKISDFLDDVFDTMQRHRSSGYPVLNEKGEVLGQVTRYHLINHRKKKVILVDHNEPEQSVPGLEQAELLEIIDHHQLGAISTSAPLFIRMEPVGSATTIVASMFFEHGVTPGVRLSGLIAGAIMSDTVMFKSPTCTERDKRMAYRMAQLAGINLEQLGVEIFSAATDIEKSSPDELLSRDFKEYILGEFKVGIGQITCLDIHQLDNMQNELLHGMEDIRKDKKLDFVLFMETEIVNEGTRMLFAGKAAQTLEDAFSVTVIDKDRAVFLPGVMSRKKQVVPAISSVLA